MKTEASLDPVITMSLHQPCQVPRMQIRARTYNLKLKRLNDTIKPERIHIIFPAPTPWVDIHSTTWRYFAARSLESSHWQACAGAAEASSESAARQCHRVL
jgi:hypothetical protein